jgi:tetraacyldisaccharide 4'-kinase
MLGAAVQRWLYRPAPGPVARLAAHATAWVAAERARRPRPPAPVPTLVVGSLSVGGAGKTPIVLLLARHLAAGGHRVGVVVRGYGGRWEAVAHVDHADVRSFGDEAAALRRALPATVSVWAGRPRRLAVEAAARNADLVLVDDGFQDPTLPRTADLLVIDATAPDGVLPAGPLREAPSAASRADLVWAHKVDEPGARPWAGAAVESVVAPVALHGPAGERRSPEWLRGRPVAMLSGIGRPASFRHSLESLGAHLEAALEQVDHHRFGSAELRRLQRTGLPIVTTTKDRERLPPGFPAWTLEVDVVVRRGWPAVEALLGRVGTC